MPAEVVFEEKVRSLQDLQVVAERMAARFKLGDWIWMDGELGAGKTTLVRLILKTYGYEGDVRSPTYALLNEYDYPDWDTKFIHLDGYRLIESTSPERPWDATEWDRYMLFAEWPEATGLPKSRFQYRIQIEVSNEGDFRSIRLISQPFS